MELNQFSGYVGVAIAGILPAYAAERLGARTGLLVFGRAVVLLALLLTVVWVKDTLPWARSDITPLPGADRPSASIASGAASATPSVRSTSGWRPA